MCQNNTLPESTKLSHFQVYLSLWAIKKGLNNIYLAKSFNINGAEGRICQKVNKINELLSLR